MNRRVIQRRCPGRSGSLGRTRAVALLLLIAVLSNCRSLVDEDADSYVSKDFLVRNWRIWSIRLVDGLTLDDGDNRFAGQPETIWTLRGTARFTEDRIDLQYSVTVSVGSDPPTETVYSFVGEFAIDRTTIWVTQDASDEVVRIGIRRDHAAILVGERMLDNLGWFDGEGNESLWVRQ